MSYAVETYQLTKRFGRITAVNSVDIKVPYGTILGIVGPNGAGKTTLLRMLVGILKPDKGKGFVLGRSIEKLTPKDKVRIGYMTQHKALYMDLTARENIEYFAKINGVTDSTKRRKLINEIIELLEIKEWENILVEHLSGGTQQLVSLACALIHQPELMILDEPTVGINPILREKFWKHFKELKNIGKTLIITTHYLEEAERCDIVAFMHNGRIIALGTPTELKRTIRYKKSLILTLARKEIPRHLLNSIEEIVNIPVKVKNDNLVINVESYEQTIRIFQLIEKLNFKVLDVKIKDPSFNEVFIEFISRERGA